MPLFLGVWEWKARFLTKKYYLSYDKLRKRGSILFLDKILSEMYGEVEIILTKPGGLELDGMSEHPFFAFIFYF